MRRPTPVGCPALPLPDPPLVDGALRLRPWQESDAAALAAAWADPEVRRWTGVPADHDVTAARRWIQGELDRRQRGLALDLVLVVDEEIVGEVGLAGFSAEPARAELGWWVHESHRGRGLASRAVRLLVDWADTELCLDGLMARCHRDNPASGSVARRAGLEGPEPGPGGFEIWRSSGTVSS